MGRISAVSERLESDKGAFIYRFIVRQKSMSMSSVRNIAIRTTDGGSVISGPLTGGEVPHLASSRRKTEVIKCN